ncbi:septin-2-like [Tubulanus polymorphus]|uniref:septin-2-like n=1 Tax=Tubulanus polymorphus TaxID=672921 RepID=UPI003DA40EFC
MSSSRFSSRHRDVLSSYTDSTGSSYRSSLVTSGTESTTPSRFSSHYSTSSSSYTTSSEPPNEYKNLSKGVVTTEKKEQKGQAEVVYLDDEECIGFASLPDQVHRKAVKRGFNFTLMVVGESGLGKSTLVNSLFLKDLYADRVILSAEQRIDKTVKIEKKYMEIEEKGVRLRLTVVDTPGFNEAINAYGCWKPIEEYVDQQFDQFFEDESGLNRKNIQDNRVHCCLYFISPYGRGLRPIDIEYMKCLHKKVNLVPIIAKADTLLAKEVQQMKKRILDQIDEHRIKIYEFPDCDSDEDEEFKLQDKLLKSTIPFAIVGSNSVVEVNGKRVRGRMYPWGIVEVENPKHSDFLQLRQMLISTHMQDLKDVTRDVHYENYRAKYITEKMTKQLSKERTKLKRESVQNWEALSDAEAMLQQKDQEILRMQEMLKKMQVQMARGGSGLGKL